MATRQYAEPSTDQVSSVTVYWASISGDKTGEHSCPDIQSAKRYECRLLNLGFYTFLDSEGVVIHG